MNKYQDHKEMSRAMNGKMILMLIGVMMVFSAITSTAQYGANMFIISHEAANGTADYVNALAEVGMSIGVARLAGAVFLAVSMVEIFVGVTCIILQNRLDKATFTRKLVIGLLGVEIVMQIFLFAVHFFNPGRLFSSLAMPLFLLWASTMLCRLAKKYPDRKYAIDTKKKEQQKPAPKKSLKERAMVPTDVTEEEEPVSENEIPESVQESEISGHVDSPEAAAGPADEE